MSELTYCRIDRGKPLVWLAGEVRTPPFSAKARGEAGFLLRRLQAGQILTMPECRAMPSVGRHCHELRVTDETVAWRIVFRIDDDAIVIAEVFKKKTANTPSGVLAVCRDRLARYDRVREGGR